MVGWKVVLIGAVSHRLMGMPSAGALIFSAMFFDSARAGVHSGGARRRRFWLKYRTAP